MTVPPARPLRPGRWRTELSRAGRREQREESAQRFHGKMDDRGPRGSSQERRSHASLPSFKQRACRSHRHARRAASARCRRPPRCCSNGWRCAAPSGFFVTRCPRSQEGRRARRVGHCARASRRSDGRRPARGREPRALEPHGQVDVQREHALLDLRDAEPSTYRRRPRGQRWRQTAGIPPRCDGFREATVVAVVEGEGPLDAHPSDRARRPRRRRPPRMNTKPAP